MAFRGAFGLGPAQRQPSGSAPAPPLQSPSAYGRTASAFPFGPAGLVSPTPASAHEPNLDPSDFPALGLGSQAPSSQTPSLLSSYASQAGTGVLPSAAGPGLGLGGPLSPGAGLPTVASALMSLAAREFSQDDFPALGGFGGPGELGLGQPPSMNGLANGGLRSTSTQEQASAVAALQHQQAQSQHRANLLGSMNGTSPMPPPNPSRQVSGGYLPSTEKAYNSKQPTAGTPGSSQWAASPTPTNQVLSSQLDSLHLSNGGAAGFPLERPSGPSPPLGSGPPGVARAIGGTSSLPSGAPPTSPLPPAGTVATSGGPGTTPQTPAQQVLFSPADRYGLLGLLHIIKTSDPDLSMLALGTDLTSLGLDLGATENLYSTFITPWCDSKAFLQLNIEPEFVLPSCYNVQPPPAQTKIGNFSDETLFFIFYSQPRDAMQEMAAHELYKHNWRYHKELRLWLTKEAGTEPTQKTQSYERGSYIFFDPTLWERVRKDFVLVFESLERKL